MKKTPPRTYEPYQMRDMDPQGLYHFLRSALMQVARQSKLADLYTAHHWLLEANGHFLKDRPPHEKTALALVRICLDTTVLPPLVEISEGVDVRYRALAEVHALDYQMHIWNTREQLQTSGKGMAHVLLALMQAQEAFQAHDYWREELCLRGAHRALDDCQDAGAHPWARNLRRGIVTLLKGRPTAQAPAEEAHA